jgi:low affinity Fe/Cu permease
VRFESLLNETSEELPRGISSNVGAPGSFLPAAAVIAAWTFTGALFDFSDTWRLLPVHAPHQPAEVGP